jgi:hypothetical protein
MGRCVSGAQKIKAAAVIKNFDIIKGLIHSIAV